MPRSVIAGDLQIGVPYSTGTGSMLPDEDAAQWGTPNEVQGIEVGLPYSDGTGTMLHDEAAALWGDERPRVRSRPRPQSSVQIGEPVSMTAGRASLTGRQGVGDLRALASNIRTRGEGYYDRPQGVPVAPKPAPRPAQAPWYQDEKQLQDVASSLVAKGHSVESTGAMIAGPGIVPWSALPDAFREAVGASGGNMLGFDPKKLDRRERELLNRLLIAGEAERKARQAAAVNAGGAAGAVGPDGRVTAAGMAGAQQ